MLQFTKLRLSGFKSFVEGTDLLVQPGLTGIVGPNGCGKSNLVEALRWVMGETSAKQMRGGEMDDVIFGGTASRPARNLAEVVLSVDNSQRTAPSMFNDFNDLEISRRIERGAGSNYRINGRDVRARDVQLLFADSATGARSTALVSQGRVSSVILAKPLQRRGLLEEAAGITGLHSRRHEAELRLRGAETNLERLEDIMAALDTQLQGLRKQARQATRYRNLSGHIRRAEATMFLLRWLQSEAERETVAARLAEAEILVVEHTRLTALASMAQVEGATALPPLRQAEAEIAAQVHRLTVARESLEAEEARTAVAIQDAKARLAQADGDIERERSLAADAAAALLQLDQERDTIAADQEGEEENYKSAVADSEASTMAVNSFETEVSALTEKAAADEAARNGLIRRISELEQRSSRLAERIEDAGRQRSAVELEAVEPFVLSTSETVLAVAQTALDKQRSTADEAEQARLTAGNAMEVAVAQRREADGVLSRLSAEEETLARMLDAGENDLWPPVIDTVSVKPGYEIALAVALGDDLSAPADEAAPVHWRTLPPLVDGRALPAGVINLADVVKAPVALARRLARIGVVADVAVGESLMGSLGVGQRLVSSDGGLWRWDGYASRPGAVTVAAARLEQRNRLLEVRSLMASASSEAEAGSTRLAAAREAVDSAASAEREVRNLMRAAESDAVQAREALSHLKEKAARHDSRLTGLTESILSLQSDSAETSGAYQEACDALSNLPDDSAARERIATLRVTLSEHRTVQVEHKSKLDSLQRDIDRRGRRLTDISRENENWNRRGEGSSERGVQLQYRRAEIISEQGHLAARPSEIETQRDAFMSSLDKAEAVRRQAADHLAVAELRLTQADRELREAEAVVARVREDRVRAQGAVEQADQSRLTLIERIAERLECHPEGLLAASEIDDVAQLPELNAIEERLQRLMRERENMGPVNLRAEQEATDLKEKLESLEVEKNDLIQAIGKLRRGIAELNHEGRERLLASFHEVDKYFRTLFERLFGGGQAHLELTDSEDPLEAGLEIMASPPGKRLQALSLLSGGEQALTALALLFAVFMTNPAPICVLDEVDAPLDDANVDRFCSLVAEIAHAGSTRFMIITHHRMTMARMDRLFGVTMMEKGVSQLVSVDLQQAEALRKTA